jgi:hypothetical protein
MLLYIYRVYIYIFRLFYCILSIGCLSYLSALSARSLHSNGSYRIAFCLSALPDSHNLRIAEAYPLDVADCLSASVWRMAVAYPSVSASCLSA